MRSLLPASMRSRFAAMLAYRPGGFLAFISFYATYQLRSMQWQLPAYGF
jgi:hypothetical protein